MGCEAAFATWSKSTKLPVDNSTTEWERASDLKIARKSPWTARRLLRNPNLHTRAPGCDATVKYLTPDRLLSGVLFPLSVGELNHLRSTDSNLCDKGPVDQGNVDDKRVLRLDPKVSSWKIVLRPVLTGAYGLRRIAASTRRRLGT